MTAYARSTKVIQPSNGKGGKGPEDGGGKGGGVAPRDMDESASGKARAQENDTYIRSILGTNYIADPRRVRQLLRCSHKTFTEH